MDKNPQFIYNIDSEVRTLNIDEKMINSDESTSQETIDEKMENVSEETVVTEEQKTKPGFFGGLKKAAIKGYDIAKAGVEKGIDLSKEGYSNVKEIYEQNKQTKEELKRYQDTYEKKTYLFEIKGTFNSKGKLESIRAFRDTERYLLFIPLAEDNIKFVRSKTTLINTSDTSEIEIEYIEMKEISIKEMKLDENTKYDVQCYQAKFSSVKNQTPSTINNISNVVNQNVNVSGQNTGDINLTSNIEIKLDHLMNEVKSVKTKMFSKEKKAQDEAIKIIGPVKDSIINGKKEKTLLQHFFDLLIVFAPTLAEAFKAFM